MVVTSRFKLFYLNLVRTILNYIKGETMTTTGRIVPTYFLVCYAFHALLSDRTKKAP